MNKKLSSFLSFAMLKSSSIDWLLLLTILTKITNIIFPFLLMAKKWRLYSLRMVVSNRCGVSILHGRVTNI